MDKTPIRAESNQLLSFMQLWCLAARPDIRENLNAFPSPVEKIIETYPDFDRDNPSFMWWMIHNTNKQFSSGQIKSIDDFVNFVSKSVALCHEGNIKLLSDKMPLEKSEINQILKIAYQSYQSYWKENEHLIQSNTDELNKIYTSDKVVNQINNIYRLFGTEQNKTCTIYLNPFPFEQKNMKGWAVDNGTHYCVSLTKSDDKQAYLENSTILKEDLSMYLHEATHKIYYDSPIHKDISNRKGIYWQKFAYFINNYKRKPGESHFPMSFNVIDMAAVNEGFAMYGNACFDRIYTADFNPATYRFYPHHKFENTLGRVMYPILEKFEKQGKQLDDTFFKEVLESEAFQKAFVEPLRKQEAARKGKNYPLNNQKNASR